jgi:hypothetical protein
VQGYISSQCPIAELSVGRKAGSLYFLHCSSNGALAGNVTLHFQDGSSFVKYISELGGKGMPRSVANWWTPDIPESRAAMQTLHTAWTGKNNHSPKVGVVVYGMNNPHPDKKIEKIVLEGAKDETKWMIIGLTLSDKEVYFKPGILSTIPNHWAAAECLYALVEGLAGIKNTGIAFDRARLAPKWGFTENNEVSATAKYESSRGYLSYRYKNSQNSCLIEFTGNSKETLVELPLKRGSVSPSIFLNGEGIDFKIKEIEDSRYALFTVNGIGYHRIEMNH